METINYRGFQIEEDFRNPYSNDPEYMYYPAEQGAQHDYDLVGEDYVYCGNCKWAGSIEEAKDQIFEKIMMAIPDHQVKMNGRFYPFTWIEEAIKFAIKYDGELFPVCNA